MTDFFDRQDSARRRTAWLLALFILAVVLIVAAVYAVATVITVWAAGKVVPAVAAFSASRLVLVATVVLLVIATGSLYKLAVLRDGGDAVARMLGGRLVEPSRAGPAERRLLNVVEEMALASGTPVPPVYVLDKEPGINAFAAGFTPGDAVVAVSRGALDHLNRDEIQGVIGHEFSHILNGDMRLNLRLIGLVHGILVISLIGQLVIRLIPDDRGGSSDKNSAAFGMLLTGTALIVIGSLGVLLGRIIKCAVARQREFLADASAVQFTRNPEGIAGALKKIGGLKEGSRVKSAGAEQACHMFFGQGVSLSGLLATHPPLTERVRRLDPSFQGTFPEVTGTVEVFEDEDADLPADVVSPLAGGVASESRPGIIPLDPGAAVATVGAPTAEHVGYAATLIGNLPRAVVEATRDPFSARAVVYALLLDPADEPVRRAQLNRLTAQAEPGTSREVMRLWPAVAGLGEDVRIPLVDLTFPALRRLSPAQYQTFRGNVDALVQADRRVSLFEYTLHRMLLRHLDRAFFRLRPPAVRYPTLDGVFADCAVLISTLARLGHQEGAGVTRAFDAAMSRLQNNHPGERAVALAAGDACTLGAVDRGLDRLAQSAPGVKRRVLDACAACIAADGVVSPGEAELLRAIADSLDCPMPPVLGPTAAPTIAAEAAEEVRA